MCSLGHRWGIDTAGRDIARDTNPQTSKDAARRITESGVRQSIKERVLEYVQDHPGKTRDEIAAGTGLERAQVWRRLSDLKNDGEIVYGAPRDGQSTIWLPDMSYPPEGQGALL